jgi:autotransporter-associated beta strand protein
VAAGATLQVQGGINVATEALTINGQGFNSQGALAGIGNDTWSSAVTLGSPSFIEVVNSSDNLVINAPITDGGSGFGIAKVGSGILTLAKNNTYGGTTTINQGTLRADGPNPTNTVGNVLLNGGSLSGVGTVGTITSTTPAVGVGTINPGDTVGTLNSKDVTLNSTDQVFVDLQGASLPNDLLVVTGNVALGSATLAGALVSPVAIRDTITIIAATGTISGTFAQGNTVFIGGQQFSVAYNVLLSSQSNPSLNGDHGVVLQALGKATTITLSSDAGSTTPVYGTPITFTATVRPASGSGTPTGTVTFGILNTVTLGVAPLNGSGVATLTLPSGSLPALPAGNNMVVAQYNGDNTFALSPLSNIVNQAVSQAGSSTSPVSISPSPGPYVFGQSVTLSATVTDASAGSTGIPTGPVSFFLDDGTGLGSGTLAPVSGSGVSGVATLVLPNGLPVGTHTIFAAYPGDRNFVASQSSSGQPYTETAATTTSLVESTANSVYGQPVAFTVFVGTNPAGGGIPNSGTVTLYVDSTPFAAVNVSAGVATFSLSTLAPGGHTFVAVYSGSGFFSASSSGAVTDTVSPAQTVTSATSSVPSAILGAQPVTFTASVAGLAPSTAVPNSVTPGSHGSMHLFIDFHDMAALGFFPPVEVNASGQASFTLSGDLQNLLYQQGIVVLGQNIFAVAFIPNAGNPNFGYSDSGPLGQVLGAPSTTTLTTAATTVGFGQLFTLAASVTRGVPVQFFTGGVVFYVDGTAANNYTDGRALFNSAIGSYVTPVDANGQASILASLPLGSHPVVAVYNFDVYLATSVSSPILETVVPADTVTALSATDVNGVPTTTSFAGDTVVFTATVSPAAPNTVVPTGSVTFYVNGVAQGTVALNGVGQAAIAMTALPVGNDTITAVFSPSADGDFNVSFTSVTQSVLTSGGRRS